MIELAHRCSDSGGPTVMHSYTAIFSPLISFFPSNLIMAVPFFTAWLFCVNFTLFAPYKAQKLAYG